MKLIKMDIEFVLIILAGIISISVALSAKISGERKERKLQESQDSLSVSQKELVKVQKKIIDLSELNISNAEKIIQIQNENQIKTDQIVSIQRQLQDKSDEVIALNKQIMERQKIAIDDSERELNTLFPMSAQMTMVTPFENGLIPAGYVEKYDELKKRIENGLDVKGKLIVHESIETKEIESLEFNRPKGDVINGINFGFITSKSVRLSVFQDDDNQFIEESDNLLFTGILSIEQMIGANGFANVSINYRNRTVGVFFNYDQFIMLKPSTYKPFGIKDLYNKYLVIKPFMRDHNTIHSISIKGNSGRTRYWLSIALKDSERRVNGDSFYYVHKITPNEVNTRIN